VEAAIPLNELGARQLEEIRFSVERVRAMRPGSGELRWRWPEHGPAAKLPEPIAKTAPVPLLRTDAPGRGTPAIEAGQGKGRPPLGSGWDDREWRDVPAWKLVRDEPSPPPPRFPAEVKLMHDGRTLAVLARCAEPGRVRAEVKERDGAVDQEDSFQVYLATSGSAYAQFAVNPLGALLDAAGMSGGPRISRPRTDWNSSARAAARLEPGDWTARLDIPLEETAKVLGEPGTPNEWRI